MNQILYTETKSKRDVLSNKKIAFIILAICLIILGGFFIGKAVFNILNIDKDLNASQPLVEISQEGNELNILVKHDKPIDKIIYKWEKDQEITIQGQERLEIEETIDVPVGTNKLNLKVIENTGKAVTYSQEYTGAEGDHKKPEVELSIENQKIKIVAKDETELDYITYYWNSEDETKVEVTEENPKQIEEKVAILKGQNTLTIIATDKAGNTEKVEQIYRGSRKPKIDVRQDGNDLVIKVSDEQGIQKIDYNLNGTFYSSDAQGTGNPLGRNEVEFKQPLAAGNNKIDIVVYNIDQLEAQFTWEGTTNQ